VLFRSSARPALMRTAVCWPTPRIEARAVYEVEKDPSKVKIEIIEGYMD
jgi:hypothetical protein